VRERVAIIGGKVEAAPGANGFTLAVEIPA
jgi:hypothetical protein